MNDFEISLFEAVTFFPSLKVISLFTIMQSGIKNEAILDCCSFVIPFAKKNVHYIVPQIYNLQVFTNIKKRYRY